MLKVELHTHTSDDPKDFVPHTALDLIDRAANLGYHALAITLHDRQLDVRKLAPYAKERGLLLIPGIERTIRGKHVLLINFPVEVEQVSSFEDVAALKDRSGGLVIAPHPFYPARCCLRGLLDDYAWLFDAVEFNHFYTSAINFNRAAARWAREHGKPLVGNCDVHRLTQLGTTFSWVDAEPDIDSVCEAIRVGRVEIQTKPLSSLKAARVLGSMALHDLCRIWDAELRPEADVPSARRSRPPAPRGFPS